MRSRVEATVVGVRIVGGFFVVDVAPGGAEGEEFTVPFVADPPDHPRVGDKVTVSVMSEGLR